jgi:hypothetical protein
VIVRVATTRCNCDTARYVPAGSGMVEIMEKLVRPATSTLPVVMAVWTEFSVIKAKWRPGVTANRWAIP